MALNLVLFLNDENHAISTAPGCVKQQAEERNGCQPYCSPMTLTLPLSLPEPSPEGHLRIAAEGFSNSTCTTPDGTLGWEVTGTVMAGDPTPASRAGASRIEIRLFRETNSVLEYLRQHPTAVSGVWIPQRDDGLTVFQGWQFCEAASNSNVKQRQVETYGPVYQFLS